MNIKTTEYASFHRPGYIAQVGLDFGTAFSKCIVRDIGTGRARVVENGSGEPYLFSSLVYYRNGEFMHEAQADSVELPFVKILLAALARRRALDARVAAWELPLRNGGVESAQAGAAKVLSEILKKAHKTAEQMMPGFGTQEDDLFYVNMCLPVDDMQDARRHEVFSRILEDAWKLAVSNQNGDNTSSKMCFLYPEVAANVQAFLKSPFAENQIGKPFFMTDVGAGTVDQSFFVTTPGLEGLTFISSLVESLGSSQIEGRCAELITQNRRPEYDDVVKKVRAFKEGRGILPTEAQATFSQVVNGLTGEMENVSNYVLSIAHQRLTRNQFRDSTVLFAGGGLSDEPYRLGVLTAFQRVWDLTPDSLELPRPNDLRRASDAAIPDAWFRRLTVAYGLSFTRNELQKIIFPNQLQQHPNDNLQTQIGRCPPPCGRPTVHGDDFCYSHQ